MGLFRRNQETLNEQLLREAGLDQSVELATPASPEPDPPSKPPELPLDIDPHSPRHKHRFLPTGTVDWDALVFVKAALAGDRIEFTTLPNGDIIVDEGTGDLSPLADAVEEKIDRPYKAVADRHENEVWAVGAREIQVAEFAFAEGDAIVLSVTDGTEQVRVDDEPSDARVSALERLGEREGPNYCVEADRIDGDFWEVRVLPL